MKKTLLGIAVALALSAGTANAQTVTVDVDTNGTTAGGGVTGVTTFDWAPGNSLVTPFSGSSATNVVVGDVLQTYFQAKLSAFLDENSNTLGTTLPGEGTLVMGFFDKVTGITGGV